MEIVLNEPPQTDSIVVSMAVSAAGHSLMALLVDSHPDITHLGDTIPVRSVYEKGYCACGLQYRNCEFWRSITAWEGFEFLRSGFPGNVLEKALFYDPMLYPLQKTLGKVLPNTRRYLKNFGSFVSFLRARCGTQCVVYGRKRISDLLLLLALCNVKVKIIHLTKHPMAQVISFRKRKARAGGSIETFAKQWLGYNAKVYKCRSMKSCVGYLHLRYEDLCEIPEEMLARLCGFLEIPYHENMMHPDRSEHHIIGAKSLIGEPGEPFAGIRMPDPKMDKLSQDEKRTVWCITQSLAERMGYGYP